MRAPKKRRGKFARRFAGAMGTLAFFAALATASLFLLIREDRLTELAKSQFARLAGEGYETDLAKASLSLFANGVAGVEIDDISIRDSKTNQSLLQRGKAKFALSLPSLLFGKIELTELTLADAEMNFGNAIGERPVFLENFKGQDGLFDPSLAAKILNQAANTVSSRLFANPNLVINASNMKLTFGGQAQPIAVLVERLVASKAAFDEFVFNAVISNQDWTSSLSGAVGRSGGGTGVTPYRVALEPIPFSRDFEPQPPDLKPRNCKGSAGLAIASSNGQANVDLSLINTNCTFGDLGDYKIDAAVNGNLKTNSGVFEIGRGKINVNRSVFNFDGAIAPARYTPKPEAAGETARYRYELVFAPSVMDSVDNVDGPLALQGKIAGTYAPAERRLALDEFVADASGSTIQGAASLLFTDVTPALYLALTSETLPAKDFKRLWPRFAAPNPRRIVQGRVLDGMLSDVRFELQLPPGKIGSRTPLERGQLTASGKFENAKFTTFGQMPPIESAVGDIEIDGKSVNIKVASGTGALPSGRKVNLSASSFSIADTHLRPVPAIIKLGVNGSADTIAELASLQPINAFAGQVLSPQDFSGIASAQAQIDLMLVAQGQKPPNPTFTASVNLDELSVAKAVNGQKITNGSGTIKADNQTVNVALDAKLNGIPAKITITEPRAAPEKRKQEISLTISDALRDQFAPGLKPFLRGPVSARILGEGQTAKVELDLTKASLRLNAMNWEKGAGVSAKASFSVRQNGADVSVSDLKITGRGLQASGTVELKNGLLQSADLKNVRLNPGDNFSLKLMRSGPTYDATLAGSQFDARAFLRQVLPGRQQQKTDDSGAFNISARLQRLVGFNDEVILNAVIGFDRGANSALSLSGDFESGGAIDLSRTNGKNARLIVQAGNAGAALRFADLYKRMSGGSLATDFAISQSGKLNGPISIRNFTVAGEPRLAKLVSEQAEGSTSLAKATQADLAGSKATFELAQGDVELDRGTIRLRKGIVRGANVGATAEGIVLSASGQMDLRGTFMPARGLNRIVGAIPILGLLLGSGNQAGLIGITYQLAGDAKNPRVFVNPISMIAPGVFRQIFE